MTGTVPNLARSLAAYGLAGTTARLPGAPLADAHWRHLLRLVRAQRLTGFLAQAVDDGALPCRADQAEQARGAHLDAMVVAVVLEAALLGIVDAFDAAGIGSRVMKGTAVAHLDYPDPALRPFGDIDLLVRSEHFDEAVAVLEGAGHRRRFPQPRPGFDRRFSKGASFTAPDGIEVDLHRTFVLGPFGLSVQLDDVWADSSEFVLGGRALTALDPEIRLLNACLHAALGDVPPRLLALRDVAQMILMGSADMTRVQSLAASWRADAAVARAVRLAWEALQLADAVALSEWARTYVPGSTQRRQLAAYLGPVDDYPTKALASVGGIRGFGNRVAFVRALAFPDRDYLAERNRGRLQRWRRAVAGLRPRPPRDGT